MAKMIANGLPLSALEKQKQTKSKKTKKSKNKQKK
jgi:hypothetical protein